MSNYYQCPKCRGGRVYTDGALPYVCSLCDFNTSQLQLPVHGKISYTEVQRLQTATQVLISLIRNKSLGTEQETVDKAIELTDKLMKSLEAKNV